MYFTCGSGRIEIEMTASQARSASHQGQCDEDVLALSKVPAITSQLEKINPETLREELREYGAWDMNELQDHEQNLQRILWLAAGDIKENEIKPLRDFLLGGPGHDGYTYNADVYCVECGQSIIRDLYESDYESLESQDTDDSPQPIFFGESDCAEHCANCGEYLYGPEEDENEEDGDGD